MQLSISGHKDLGSWVSPRRVDAATRQSLNRAATAMHTLARRSARATYKVKPKTLNRVLKKDKASYTKQRAGLWAGGAPIHATDFPHRKYAQGWLVHPGNKPYRGGRDVGSAGGRRVREPRSFKYYASSGKVMILQRRPWAPRYPVDPLYGPTAEQMTKPIANQIRQRGWNVFLQRMKHEQQRRAR